MWLYYVIVAAVFFATLAMMVREGLWSNTITLVNIVLSGLVALGFFLPWARSANQIMEGSLTYLLDFCLFWAIYAVTFVVLHRVLAGRLSQTRMRFKFFLDDVGGPLVGMFTGWLVAGLVLASLHAAPFPKECLGGALMVKEDSNPLLHPELGWLSLMEKLLSPEQLGGSGPHFKQQTYISQFARQREALDGELSLLVD